MAGTKGSGIAAAAVAALALIATLALLAGAEAEAETKAKERLAADFELLTIQQVQANKIVPQRDQKRTAKCLAAALAADIPEADAARLSDIFEGRAKSDPALQKKWLTISAKEAPARNAQVLAQVDKLCADLGPYVKQML